MKRIVILIAIILLSGNGLNGQTKVVKVNAAKANDYGVRYVLPKTVLQVQIEYTEVQQKAGIYAKYASRYLGVEEDAVCKEDRTTCTLNKITVDETGVPNKDQSYLVLFKQKTVAPFVYLTEDGIICTINAEYVADAPKTKPAVTPAPELTLDPQSIYTEEYLNAGSTAKMAEEAAKSIYSIRRSRQDILTGEADNMPKDGAAMQIVLNNLDAQEKLWTELFTGKTTTVSHTKTIAIEPSGEVDKEILCRFSKYNGVVDTDDLSGNPIYWSLKKDPSSADALPNDPKRKKQEATSIVYNIPGKAEISIFYGNKTVYAAQVNVTQFGTTDILATEIFEDKKAPVQIVFYPSLGAIKHITQ